MRIRNVDKNNDWTFGQSLSNYVQNEYAIELDIKLKIQEWYQDCFFALTNGIPWQIRLGSKRQKQLLDRDLINTVRSIEGVLNIFDFTSSTDGRRYRAQMNVFTRYSTDYLPINIDTEDFINA